MTKAVEKDLRNKKQEMKLKEQEALEFYRFLKDNGYIIYEAIVGSQAHGTSTPQSDVDKAFVYILPEDHLLGLKYKEQLRVNADYTGYEIRRFLELAHSNNPTILELFYGPEDCIETMDSVFKYALEMRDEILTKRCKHSFSGYAKKQITKAKGLDKMQNWEKGRVERKEPIDFCYVLNGYGSQSLKEFLEGRLMEQKFCGITKIPNARDTYALFYDWDAHHCFSEQLSEEEREHNKKRLKELGRPVGLGYKGISKTGVGENVAESNQLRLSAIPRGERVYAHMVYNKDGYTAHCKDYNNYQDWLENRNEKRWVETKEHGQMIDGKNMMHCVRLLQIAREIADTGTITIRRPNREELLNIRKGGVSLEELIEWSENEMRELDVLFDNSTLPDEVNTEVIHNTLVKIRKEFYETRR